MKGDIPRNATNLKPVYDYLEEHGPSKCADIAKYIGRHDGATYNALRALKWHRLITQNQDKKWRVIKEWR